MIAYAGLLWTHTRAAYLALALGLVVLAVAQRRLAAGRARGRARSSSASASSRRSRTSARRRATRQTELVDLRRQGQQNPGVSDDPLSAGDASTSSHLRNLREGIRTVVHQPLGFGLGNAGVSASRTGVEIKAGESTYTELGVETGLAGLAVFLAWMAAVLLGLWRRSAWLSAAWVTMLAIGVQTDVIGVHWIAYVLFALAGAAIGGGLPRGRRAGPA